MFNMKNLCVATMMAFVFATHGATAALVAVTETPSPLVGPGASVVDVRARALGVPASTETTRHRRSTSTRVPPIACVTLIDA